MARFQPLRLPAEPVADLRIPVNNTPPASVPTEAGGLPLPRCVSSSPGTLYVVSLPIGNPEDITLRAMRVLREVTLVAAESIRSARSILNALETKAEVISVRSRFGAPALDMLLSALESGRDAAVITDAGTPGIADPGANIVRAVIDRGFGVTSVPGATALIAALALSGLSAETFTFYGYPPLTRPERQSFFIRIASCAETAIIYESPRRLCATLTEIRSLARGDAKIAVASNLTCDSEQVFRGTLEEAVEKFRRAVPPGEVTLILQRLTAQ